MITSKNVWTIEDAPDDAGRIDRGGSITLGLVCHRETTTRKGTMRRRVMDARLELRRNMPVVVLFYSAEAARYALAEGHRLTAQVYDTVTDLNSEAPREERIEIIQVSIEEKINVEELGDGCTRVTVYGGTTSDAALCVAGFFCEEVMEIAMGAW